MNQWTITTKTHELTTFRVDGTEEHIIEAARMSVSKGFEGWEKDERLLRYLFRHKHASVFEMVGAVFIVQCPIFTMRQFMRHRALRQIPFDINEHSCRYTTPVRKMWIPDLERMKPVASANKQANSQATMGALDSDEYRQHLQAAAVGTLELTQALHQEWLNAGVPREVARAILPQGAFTAVMVKGSLRNWLDFLYLRDCAHAQTEIRALASDVAEELAKHFPRTMAQYWLSKEQTPSKHPRHMRTRLPKHGAPRKMLLR